MAKMKSGARGITIRVPARVHRALRIRAAQESTTISEAALRTITEAMPTRDDAPAIPAQDGSR